MILAGDIGGTNTRLALFEKTGELKIVTEEIYPSREFKGLEEIVLQFLQEKKVAVNVASFGIAGPVRDQKCRATNLPWVVDAQALAKASKIASVRLYNDLESNANGLKVLQPGELYCLQQGLKQVGNQALIAAGTGLGEAGLFWDGKGHRPFACEGGHADFAPRNEEEVELLSFLRKKYGGHISYERVVSGPGMFDIYSFLAKGPTDIKNPRDVTENDGKDPLCTKTIDWFLSLYGAESGNMALKFLSLGGFYVGGGIAPRLKDRFAKSDFLASFSDKGRFKELLQSIPIHIVLNDNTALLGAASFGRDL